MIDFDLIDVVLIAKNIIDKNEDLVGLVQLDRQFLGKEIFDINNKNSLHTRVFKIKSIVISEIKRNINEEIDIKIFLHEKEVSDTMGKLAGFVIKETEIKSSVHINNNETYCTQRFATCKELIQILVDSIYFANKEVNPQDQMIEAARELIQKFYSPSHSPELVENIESSEMFAQLVALEIMIPYTIREKIDKEREKGATVEQIAAMLYITKESIEGYMNKYYSLTTPIYKVFKN